MAPTSAFAECAILSSHFAALAPEILQEVSVGDAIIDSERTERLASFQDGPQQEAFHCLAISALGIAAGGTAFQLGVDRFKVVAG